MPTVPLYAVLERCLLMWALNDFLFFSGRVSKSALFFKNSITVYLILAKAKNSFTLIFFLINCF